MNVQPSPRGAIKLALLLASINTAVIAIGFGTVFGESSRFGFSAMVFVVGIGPALIVGAVAAMIANRTSDRPPLVRLAFIFLPAAACLLGLAYGFELIPWFVWGLVPTLACSYVLERQTRIGK